jgi:hypothetical protein
MEDIAVVHARFDVKKRPGPGIFKRTSQISREVTCGYVHPDAVYR